MTFSRLDPNFEQVLVLLQAGIFVRLFIWRISYFSIKCVLCGLGPIISYCSFLPWRLKSGALLSVLISGDGGFDSSIR